MSSGGATSADSCIERTLSCPQRSKSLPQMLRNIAGNQGIILSLLAQRYSPEEAAVLGVYLHGLAGDLAAEEIGQDALIASDITEHLGKAFGTLRAR